MFTKNFFAICTLNVVNTKRDNISRRKVLYLFPTCLLTQRYQVCTIKKALATDRHAVTTLEKPRYFFLHEGNRNKLQRMVPVCTSDFMLCSRLKEVTSMNNVKIIKRSILKLVKIK
jgi:hypothetical protein